MEPELVEGLQHDIEVWRRGEVVYDSHGNESQLYKAFATYKGRFEYLTGAERRNAEETEIYRQRVIFDAGVEVTAADQIRFDNRQFQISTVYTRYDFDGEESHRVAYLEEVI